MEGVPHDAVAVIFVSQARDGDLAGYDAASAAMEAEAARQPGHLGMDSTRGQDGLGITVSYWVSDAAAIAWRDHAGHSAIRATARAQWYDAYRVVVAKVERSYGWRAGAGDRQA